MTNKLQSNPRGWVRKFADALDGLRIAVRGSSSFFVHLLMATVVVAAAAVLRAPREEWCLLVVAIAAVLVAEAFNTAVERLAAAVHPAQSPAVRDALHIAAAAVLVASCGAAIVGAIVFTPKLWILCAPR